MTKKYNEDVSIFSNEELLSEYVGYEQFKDSDYITSRIQSEFAEDASEKLKEEVLRRMNGLNK
jgi:hypothetical protein